MLSGGDRLFLGRFRIGVDRRRRIRSAAAGSAGGCRMASTARCSVSASSGFTTQPSAALRLARCTSASRSSSISTGTCGSRPDDSSRRSAMVTAMPPIEPICRSRMASRACARPTTRADVAAVAADRERGVGTGERGGDLVEDEVGVGGDQDVHDRTLPAHRISPRGAARRASQVANSRSADGAARRGRARRRAAAAPRRRRRCGPTLGRRAVVELGALGGGSGVAARRGCAHSGGVDLAARAGAAPGSWACTGSRSARRPPGRCPASLVGEPAGLVDRVELGRRHQHVARASASAAGPSRRRLAGGTRSPCRRRPGRRRSRRPARRRRRPCRSCAAPAARRRSAPSARAGWASSAA